MRVKLIILLIIALLLPSCGMIDISSTSKNIRSTTGCNVDYSEPREMQRLSFKYPPVLAHVQPCESIYMIYSIREDSLSISVRGAVVRGNVVTQTSNLGIYISGELHNIGNPRPVMRDIGFERPDRIVETKSRQEQRRGMNCIRVDTFTRAPQGTPLGRGIVYSCLDPEDRYPIIDIRTSYTYANGKPLYPGDLDEDILNPIFESLELKPLSEEAFEKRARDFELNFQRDCKKRIRRMENLKRENKYYIPTVGTFTGLERCGFDITEYRKWWCDNTIADSKKDIEDTPYRLYKKSFESNLKACLDDGSITED